MKYQVTVLTPTLVGDGSKLSPIDYMVWRDQVNVLDQQRIFKLLSKGPRLEGYLTQLRRATKLDFASWGGFAQNYADRRIPFEDPSCTPQWERAPLDSLNIPTFAAAESGPFLPGSALKGALRTGFVFSNGPDRAASEKMRVISVADSGAKAAETFKVYMLRVAKLVPGGPSQFTLGWKGDAPGFAEMAAPGTTFAGMWSENTFLNGEEVRRALRWNAAVTRERLFEAANLYAEKQLQLHAQYAGWSGLSELGISVAELQKTLVSARNEGDCLLSIGWGGGFVSKSAAIGLADEEFRKVLGALPYYERAIKSGMPFPKTRKIVFLKNKPAALPGWIRLRVD